jgi:carotenoid cleavage dioxygenase-like enzyme
MSAESQPNPFLSGNFAPIPSEDAFTDLPVWGEVPRALAGTFYRNGPNPQFPPRDFNHHWFAGDGMIHAFAFSDGKVSYRNRFVQTPKWQLEHAAGRALFGTFGNPATSDPSAIGKDGGLANTNIIGHAGRLLALEEAHQPFELDPDTLAPRGYLPYAGGAGRFTAHPKTDPETGDLVFFGYRAGEGLFSEQIAYGVVDRNGEVTRCDSFAGPYCSMIHDFFVTQRHVGFPVLPLTFSLDRAMRGAPPIAWEPEKGSHVGLMRRDAEVGTMRWFATDACYVFHPMNVWEEGDRLYADVMQFETAPLFPNADGSPPKLAAARLARWTFDLSGKTDTIQRDYIDDLSGEFPRFDERRAGLPYAHGYFAADTRGTADDRFDSIVHIDVRSGRRQVYTFDAGDGPEEPIFVPRGAAEGDGWLLSIVYRGRENRSDLAIFDALAVDRGPIGLVRLPRRIPFGFHGNWVAAS